MSARASALATPPSAPAPPGPSQGSASLPAIIAANAAGAMSVPNSARLPRRVQRHTPCSCSCGSATLWGWHTFIKDCLEVLGA